MTPDDWSLPFDPTAGETWPPRQRGALDEGAIRKSLSSSSYEDLCCKAYAWAEQMSIEACISEECGEFEGNVPERFPPNVEAFLSTMLAAVGVAQAGTARLSSADRRLLRSLLLSPRTMTSFSDRLTVASKLCEN